MTNEIFFSALRKAGFHSDGDNSRALSRVLFTDYSIEIAAEEEWESDRDCYVYLKSARFSRVMNAMFQNAEFSFSEYKGRKLRKDTTGTLAMALIGLEDLKGEISLASGGKQVSIPAFVDFVDNLNGPSNVKHELFGGELERFLAPIEGVWVYLYLAVEEGLTPNEILDSIASEDPETTESWRLKRPLDCAVCTAFEVAYKSTVN